MGMDGCVARKPKPNQIKSIQTASTLSNKKSSNLVIIIIINGQTPSPPTYDIHHPSSSPIATDTTTTTYFFVPPFRQSRSAPFIQYRTSSRSPFSFTVNRLLCRTINHKNIQQPYPKQQSPRPPFFPPARPASYPAAVEIGSSPHHSTFFARHYDAAGPFFTPPRYEILFIEKFRIKVEK